MSPAGLLSAFGTASSNGTLQQGRIIAANASFVLEGVPFADWTEIMTGTLQLVLVALIKEPQLMLNEVNLTAAYPGPEEPSLQRRLLLEQASPESAAHAGPR